MLIIMYKTLNDSDLGFQWLLFLSLDLIMSQTFLVIQCVSLKKKKNLLPT